MSGWLLVGLGGGAGAALRYQLMTWSHARGIAQWPWGIFVANVVGSFILGVLLVPASQQVWLLVGVGFCGGLTTFSTYAADVVALAAISRRRAAAAYALGSLVAGLAAAALGLGLATIMWSA